MDQKIPISIVEKLCPSCAKSMRAKGWTHINLKQIPAQLREGLCSFVGRAEEGFFTRCMDLSFGDFVPSNKEGFCNHLKSICIKCAEASMQKTWIAKDISDDGGRRITARISTQDVDRDGDVLVPQGCDFTRFQENPVVFFAHDYETLPIGKCIDISKNDDDIIATTEFAERPKSHPDSATWMPDTLLDLFRQKILKGFSVGLDPIEMRPAKKADIQRFGKGVTRVVSKWHLLEYSIAPIPTNDRALAMAVSKGIVSAKAARGVCPELEIPKKKAIIICLPPVKKKTRQPDVALLVTREVKRAAGQLYE